MNRILIVDDYEDLTHVIRTFLKREGFIVETCNSAEQVFPKIYAFSPDLIILDIFLGNETGRSICMKIKEMNSLKHIPIILYTAQILPEEFLTGCNYAEFIQKPFDTDDFLNKINRHLPKVELDT